jgi:DNA-binding transcriptional LysR family regulator
MHSRLLQQFLAVAEKRNVTAAAEALHISQPALTRSIRQLEHIIGVTLFERLPTGVALTRQGEILARRAKLMDLEYRHALAEISALDQGLTGVLRVGAGPLWITSLLPPVIAAFCAQYPKVKTRLTSGVIDTLVPDLLSGDIDVFCSNLDFPAQSEIVKEPLLDVHHTVVARDSHPLAKEEKASAEQLSKYRWLVLANDTVGINRIHSYFVAHSLAPPTIAVETVSMGIIKILREGDFLALFPERMLADAARFDLVPIPHEGTFWESTAGIAYRRTNRPIRPVESFKAILKASLSE